MCSRMIDSEICQLWQEHSSSEGPVIYHCEPLFKTVRFSFQAKQTSSFPEHQKTKSNWEKFLTDVHSNVIESNHKNSFPLSEFMKHNAWWRRLSNIKYKIAIVDVVSPVIGLHRKIRCKPNSVLPCIHSKELNVGFPDSHRSLATFPVAEKCISQLIILVFFFYFSVFYQS